MVTTNMKRKFSTSWRSGTETVQFRVVVVNVVSIVDNLFLFNSGGNGKMKAKLS